jgi:sugar phosphate isomerase/epimerase
MGGHEVILTGFADEGPATKRAEEQLAIHRALGMSYYTIRFVDAGEGIKNVMKLSDAEITRLQGLHREYGMKVSSIGSPIGKIKLVDREDGTTNVYIPFDRYLREDVAHAIHLARACETKLIRGFSFYHPRGEDPAAYLDRSADYLKQIAAKCREAGVYFGLEVESHLVGQNGATLEALHRKVASDHLCLGYDCGNIELPGFSAAEALAQYRQMEAGLGWIHIKGASSPADPSMAEHLKSRNMAGCISVDQGDAGHEMSLRSLRAVLPDLNRTWQSRGVPGVFMDLEPHVKAGGQFGGFSGPDGYGVAFRGLLRLLDYLGIGYPLTDFHDLRNP